MENIINKIKFDTEAEITAMLNAAKADAERRVERAKADIERDAESALERAKRRVEAATRAAEIQDKTASRREDLLARQAIIDEVFGEVQSKLLKLGAADKKKLVDALVKKFGSKDDKVVQAGGGVVLENPKYTRSLTVDELLAALREKVELEVAKILFA